MATVFTVTEETAKLCVVWACGVCPDLNKCFTFSAFLLHFLPASVLFSFKPECNTTPLLKAVTRTNKPYHCKN